jgi:methylglutaconyl-CoA hydratase
VIVVTFVVWFMSYQFIATRRAGPVEYLTLNRPDVRNAFNEELGKELTAWAEAITDDQEVRVVVLDGAGKVFCAGADLTWMARMAAYTHEENVRDATAMAHLFYTLDRLPAALIGRIHGAALGGGAGLAAVCDIVVADEQAVFGFTEVKLGIVPSIISPYVLTKIGVSAARELFLTGMRFGAARAREIGLVHAVVPVAELDERVAGYVQEVLTAAPEAVATAKELIRKVWARPAQDILGITADTIAARRASEEGQEGMKAFLEKRKAPWHFDRS